MNHPRLKRLRITRRQFGFLAATAAAGLPLAARAQARQPYLADMHSHYGQFLPRLFGLDLNKHMQDNGIMLMAWAVVDDQKWMTAATGNLRQASVPQPGDLWAYFQARMADYEGRLAQWKVRKALASADVDDALAGQPRLLLATESANFLEGQVERVALAHAMGVRHMQLVHYIQSPLGDHQTAEPTHGGLTPLGTKVVAECKRLGIVVDLAHGTAALVDGALDASDAAMVWSHSWITPGGGTHRNVGYIARSLSLDAAKKIAARGGAVGLWNLKLRPEPTGLSYPVNSIKDYADEIMRMCDLIGPRHVAFGTDLEGVWPGRLMNSYDDLREVAENLMKRGLAEAVLHDVFIGNYARIVKAAMAGAAPA